MMLVPNIVDADAYRRLVKSEDLISVRVHVKQTDLLISGTCDLQEKALPLVKRFRKDIEDYLVKRPLFGKSFAPIDPDARAPEIVRTMIEASTRARVGPMASVAGAVAECVGRGLMPFSSEIIVENGGDVFLFTSKRREMLLLAESSKFKGLRIALDPTLHPAGICTSSGILGGSISLGRADAVMVMAPSAAFADAAATAIGNMVKRPSDLNAAVEAAQTMGVDAVVILIQDNMAAWGQVEILG
jgi:ApbE superfamily uncharacterized protein (UPF0280 family)